MRFCLPIRPSGGNVLGEIPHVILDEAHNLEREATDHYSRSVARSEINELLNSLGADSEDGRPRIVTTALGSSAGTTAQAMEAAGAEVAAAARSAANRTGQFFNAAGAIAAGSRSDRGGDSRCGSYSASGKQMNGGRP